jgi:hypothetical protein
MRLFRQFPEEVQLPRIHLLGTRVNSYQATLLSNLRESLVLDVSS